MESHECMAAAPSCYVTRHASRAHNPHACAHILQYRPRLGLTPSHAPLSVKAARHQWPALSRLLCCNTSYCVALVACHQWPALSHCLRLSATATARGVVVLRESRLPHLHRDCAQLCPHLHRPWSQHRCGAEHSPVAGCACRELRGHLLRVRLSVTRASTLDAQRTTTANNELRVPPSAWPAAPSESCACSAVQRGAVPFALCGSLLAVSMRWWGNMVALCVRCSRRRRHPKCPRRCGCFSH
jgi:hypothetical protein